MPDRPVDEKAEAATTGNARGTSIETAVTAVTTVTATAEAAPALDRAPFRNVTDEPAGTVTAVTKKGGVPPEQQVQQQPPIPEEMRPCFRVYMTRWWFADEPDTKPRRPGVWWHGLEGRGQNVLPVDRRVCGPLWLSAISRDVSENTYGIVLDFIDLDGRRRRLAQPRSVLAGDENLELERQLREAGLEIEPGQRRRLFEYLRRCRSEHRVVGASRTGWLGGFDAFVMPERTIGRSDVVFLDPEGCGAINAPASNGEPRTWRTQIAALAEDNPIFSCAVAISLAGPLLRLCDLDSTGIHFFGDSSTGKSTLLRIAASIWGAGEEGLVRTWNATRNGLEAIAALHNDTVLCLDEIGEAVPTNIEDIIYALGNNVGRSRANRSGGARAVRMWRVMVLSTGEQSITDYLGAARIETKRGVRARLLDLPARGRFGMFDELHGFASGRHLAEHLADHARRHYGFAGPAFVQWILERDVDRVRNTFAQTREVFARGISDPTAQRAVRIFALAATAGRLAVEAGILPWRRDWPLEAAKACLCRWREESAPRPLWEEALERLRRFVDRHGASRFSAVDGDDSAVVRDRAGWRERDANGDQLWLFTPAGFREALDGLDGASAAEALRERGILRVDGTGRRTVRRRLDGEQRRVYPVRFPQDPEDEDAIVQFETCRPAGTSERGSGSSVEDLVARLEDG